jgi:hypothetical protein
MLQKNILRSGTLNFTALKRNNTSSLLPEVEMNIYAAAHLLIDWAETTRFLGFWFLRQAFYYF